MSQGLDPRLFLLRVSAARTRAKDCIRESHWSRLLSRIRSSYGFGSVGSTSELSKEIGLLHALLAGSFMRCCDCGKIDASPSWFAVPGKLNPILVTRCRSCEFDRAIEAAQVDLEAAFAQARQRWLNWALCDPSIGASASCGVEFEVARMTCEMRVFKAHLRWWDRTPPSPPPPSSAPQLRLPLLHSKHDF